MNFEDSVIILDDDEDEETPNKTNQNPTKITSKTSGFPSEVRGYTKPSYSFPQLVTQALATCPNRTATAIQICDLIAQKQPYYKYYPGEWHKYIYSALTRRKKFFVIVGTDSNKEFVWTFNPTFEKYMLNKWVPKYLKTKSGVDRSNANPVFSTSASESSGNSTARGPVIISARSLRAEETREMQTDFALDNPKQVPESNIVTDTCKPAKPWEPEVTVSELAPSIVTSDIRNEQKSTVTVPDGHQISNEEVIYRLSFQKEHSDVHKFRLHCTICDVHLGSAGCQLENVLRLHPQLGVLICRSCGTETSQGQSDICSWCCKLDGVFFLCSTCPSKFCEACIKRNFGVAWCSKLAGRRDWKCFLCFTKQIWPHRAIAHYLFRHLKQLLRKKTMLEKTVFALHNLKKVDLQFFETDLSECCKQKSDRERASELASDLSPSLPESVYAMPLPVLQPETSSHNVFVNRVPWVTVNTGTQYIQNLYSGPESCAAASASPPVPPYTTSPQMFTNMVSKSGPLPEDNPILLGMLNTCSPFEQIFSGENQSKFNFAFDKNFMNASSVKSPIRLHNSTNLLHAPPTPSTSHVTANSANQSLSYDSLFSSETNDNPEVEVIVDSCLMKESIDSSSTGIPNVSTNTAVCIDVSNTSVDIQPRGFLIKEGNCSTAVMKETTEQVYEEVMPTPVMSLRERINNRPMPKSKKQTLLQTVLMSESIESMKRHLQSLQPTISGTDSSNSESISNEARIKNKSTAFVNPQAAGTSENNKHLEKPILQSIIDSATKALCLLDNEKKQNSAQSTSVAKITDRQDLNDICEPHCPTSAPLNEIPKIKIRTLEELQDPSRLRETRQNDFKEPNQIKVNIINPEPDEISINVDVEEPEQEINVTSLKRGIIETSRTLVYTQKKLKELAKVISCNLSYKPDQAGELVNKFQEIVKNCRMQIDVIDTNIMKEFVSLLPACNSDKVLGSNNNNIKSSKACDENNFDQPSKVKRKKKKRKRSKIHPRRKPPLEHNVNGTVATTTTLIKKQSQSSGREYEKSDDMENFTTRKRKKDFINFHTNHKMILFNTSNKPEVQELSSTHTSDSDYDLNEDVRQKTLLMRQTLCKKYKRKKNIWAARRKYRHQKKVGDVVHNLDGSIRKRLGRPPKTWKQNQLCPKPKTDIVGRRLSGRQHPSSAALGIDSAVVTCHLPPHCEIKPCSVMLHKLNQRFVQLLTRNIQP